MAPVNLYGTSGMLSCFFSWGLLALAPGVPKDRLSPTPPTDTTTANDSSFISLLLSHSLLLQQTKMWMQKECVREWHAHDWRFRYRSKHRGNMAEGLDVGTSELGQRDLNLNSATEELF